MLTGATNKRLSGWTSQQSGWVTSNNHQTIVSRWCWSIGRSARISFLHWRSSHVRYFRRKHHVRHLSVFGLRLMICVR